MEVIDGDPPLVLDAAHNPAGAAALAEALPAVAGGRPVIACLAVLADKDAAGLVGALAPALAGRGRDRDARASGWPQRGRPGARALEACDLAEVAREAGIGWVEEEPIRRRRSRGRASSPTPRAASSLVTGSHYLLRYAGELARRSSGEAVAELACTSRLSQSVWSLVQPWRSLK